MGEIIWVEILSPQGEVMARHRCVGRGIRIGRAYTNDVILDDPVIAPEHLHVVRDEDGALIAEDLGSANGLFAGRGKQRVARVVLDGEQTIRVGQTFLRIRTADYAVAPDHVARRPVRRWPALATLAVALLGLELATLWLRVASEAEPSYYLVPVLAASVALLGWAGLWTMATRIIGGGKERFAHHLLITLAGLLAASIYYEVAAIVAFALSWPLVSAFQYVGLWCFLGIMCFLHLRTVGRPRSALKLGALTALVIAACAAQAVIQFSAHNGFDQRDHVRRLMPPSLRIAPLKSEDAFFAEITRLKSKIDSARNEDTP